ncbi:transcriptional regulator [Pseudomonas coleopterorum]|uniref:transcriptional regulator n=1 Tax=Pseudomonas coleopterorum TaxID=1605838 RepID=UPI00089DA265|nr:transcriptional regulator [Pseudomonas coleopterorum]SEE01306.1 hypothetical protein SAMN05216510_1165 [Pseudomonas coleopterorum]
MTTYNWQLIERLLHEVQNGAHQDFTPDIYAQDHAEATAAQGDTSGTVDQLATQASDYQALLLERGFIEQRPDSEGGTGRNFQLTLRGSSLLSLIDSSIPDNDHGLEVLDDQADALDPVTFDEVASKPQIV